MTITSGQVGMPVTYIVDSSGSIAPSPPAPPAAPTAMSLNTIMASAGEIPGVQVVQVIGHNPDVDSGTTPEDLWEPGGLYQFQTVVRSLEILSTNAADTAAGTGLRTVRVTGLDGTYTTITEDVTMNGVGVVALTKQYLRINDVFGLTAGTGGTNAGVITLRVAGAGASQSVIGIGEGRAHTGVYTVPVGKSAYLAGGVIQILRTATAAASAEVALCIRPVGGVLSVRNLFSLWSQGTSTVVVPIEYPVALPEKIDLWGRANFVSSNDSSLTMTLFVVIVDASVLVTP